MLLTLFRLLSHLPLSVLHLLGGGLGWLVYFGSATYRQRLRQNLDRAGYRAHLGKSISAVGKSMAELPFIWCAPAERVLATAEVENWSVVQSAIDSGRGLILLTPHLGCFELIAQVVAQHLPFTVLYRPPRKAALKPLIEGARQRHNLLLAPANLSGVRMLLKALKKGGVVGLLPDQVPQNGEGVWADFYAHPAYSMSLPGKLQQMSGAMIVLCYAERKAAGAGYLVRFIAFDAPLGETALSQATAINHAMEQLIARCPEQYFWSYNRYKTPAGVAAPEVAS